MTNFVFDILKLSLETDLKQVSYILNKYSEFNSRQKYPKIWKITDVLTDTKSNKHRTYKSKLSSSFRSWTVGLFLIISQLIDNKFNIFFFIIGLACYILGIITLFMVNKNLLGLLSVVQVLAILIALFINVNKFKTLIPLAILNVIVIIWIILYKSIEKRFDKSAKILIEKLSNTPENSKIIFNDDFITLYIDDNNKTTINYNNLRYVIDSENLIGIVYYDYIIIAKKYDNFNTFNSFINRKIK